MVSEPVFHPLLELLVQLAGLGLLVRRKNAIEFGERVGADREHLAPQISLCAGELLNFGAVVRLHRRGESLAIFLELLDQRLRLLPGLPMACLPGRGSGAVEDVWAKAIPPARAATAANLVSECFIGLLPQFRLCFFRVGGRMLARAADDGHYWFFMLSPGPRVGSWFLMPEHLVMLAVAALMSWWLALHFTAPLRQMHKAVERFGRAFDRMAGRIETLLKAERRLLLDISHELRSPLARLGVAVELARSGEDLQTHLNRIQKESDRLNALVGQLLDVTRAEGDPNALRRETIQLDELVQQLVDDSGIEASARGCALLFEKREPVAVEGDPELIRRAVENVIRNAIRYSPRDTQVEISLARSGAKAAVVVRDHGPGVPEEALPRLFDPFYRVDTARDRASGGIGLGLSIARRALDLHKGAIRARNASPGLEVEIELPAK